jgi:hypothetical protein
MAEHEGVTEQLKAQNKLMGGGKNLRRPHFFIPFPTKIAAIAPDSFCIPHPIHCSIGSNQ